MSAMDQDHVDAQVFYPNITGTTGDAFFGQEPDFEAEACRAYNDYQTEEFINVNPERFCGLTSLPYGHGIARTVEGGEVREERRPQGRCHDERPAPARPASLQ